MLKIIIKIDRRSIEHVFVDIFFENPHGIFEFFEAPLKDGIAQFYGSRVGKRNGFSAPSQALAKKGK